MLYSECFAVRHAGIPPSLPAQMRSVLLRVVQAAAAAAALLQANSHGRCGLSALPTLAVGLSVDKPWQHI